jgi:hypothetical protein
VKESGKELLVLMVVAAMVAVVTVAELLLLLMMMMRRMMEAALMAAGAGLQVVPRLAGLHQASGEEGNKSKEEGLCGKLHA